MEIEKDTLFLALTRPAMKFGVPAEAFMANFVLSFFVGLWGGNPFLWLVCIAIHFPMRVIASVDHNFFRIWRLWLTAKASSSGGDVWGGDILSPMPDWAEKKATERSSCV
jgi:type IV secretion system protein VirB3